MKKINTIMFVAVACALLLAAISGVTPKAVRAAIATLVRDQDNPARHVFSAGCGTTTLGGEAVCVLVGQVPTGEEYVIQTESIFGSAEAGINQVIIELQSTPGGSVSRTMRYLTPKAASDAVGLYQFGDVRSNLLYADPGTAIECRAITGAPNVPDGLSLNCAIQGYWVSVP